MRAPSGWTFTVLLVLWVSVAVGLPTAYHPLPATIPDNGQNHKNDFCSRAQEVKSGARPLKTALQGMNVSVGYIYYEDTWLAYNKDTNMITGGYHYELLHLVAQRGGFGFQMGIMSKRANQTWTEFTQERQSQYDILADAYTDIADRRTRRSAFPFHILDQSFILVTQKDYEEDALLHHKLFSFLAPFDDMLWVLIIFSLVFTALVYWLMESGIKHHDDMKKQDKYVGTWLGNFTGNAGRAMYLSVAAFTGAGGFTPKTPFGRLFNASWTFALLLIVSAYTANLASLLIGVADESSGIETPQDVLATAGAKVCIWAGTAQHQTMKSMFPDMGFHEVPGVAAALVGVREEQCVAAAMGVVDWAENENYEAARNRDRPGAECDMQMVGRPFKTAGASWIVEGDAAASCSSLVADVLALLFLELGDEHELDALLERALEYVKKNSNAGECPEIEEKTELTALSVSAMGGIFLLHAFITIVCVIASIPYTMYYQRRRATKKQLRAKALEEIVTNGLGSPKGGKDAMRSHLLKGSAEGIARLERTMTAMASRIKELREQSKGQLGGKISTITSDGDIATAEVNTVPRALSLPAETPDYAGLSGQSTLPAAAFGSTR